MGEIRRRPKVNALLSKLNLAVSRQRPYVTRRYPYRHGRAMLKALGPKLGASTNWTTSDSLLDGDLAAIFSSTPGVHKWAHYLPIYERLLSPNRSRPIRMLEIGVYKGGSLEMWRRYLHPSSLIVGIDINPSCKQYEDPDRNVHVRIGSQADPEFLANVADEFGPFNVILDDGSHRSAHMVTTFQHMFDSVAEGGVYVVEDIHADYWPSFRDSPMSFVDFTKFLIDAMHAHYLVIERESDLRVGNASRCLSVEVPSITTHLGGIEFYDSVAVFHRLTRGLPSSIHQ